MAKRTYLELCVKAQRDCHVQGSDLSSVTGQVGMLANIVRWVADADEFIQSKHIDWNFLWSQWSTPTIAGTKNYVAPTDIGQWDYESFYLDQTANSYQHLTVVDYKEWRKTYRNGTQSNAKPVKLTVQPDKSISLYPVPDSAYSLTADYFKRPTRLSSNTNTSDIPEQFEQTIIELVKARYAEDQGSEVLLLNANAELAYWIEQLEKSELPDQYRRGMMNGSAITVMAG